MDTTHQHKEQMLLMSIGIGKVNPLAFGSLLLPRSRSWWFALCSLVALPLVLLLRVLLAEGAGCWVLGLSGSGWPANSTGGS